MLRSITPVEASVLRTTVSGLRFFNPVLSVLLLLILSPVTPCQRNVSSPSWRVSSPHTQLPVRPNPRADPTPYRLAFSVRLGSASATTTLSSLSERRLTNLLRFSTEEILFFGKSSEMRVFSLSFSRSLAHHVS